MEWSFKMKFKMPILRYTFKVIKDKKLITLFNVVCLSLFIVCVCCFTNLINSYVTSTDKYLEQLYGTEDAVLKNVTIEDIEKINTENSSVDIGLVKTYGFAPIEKLPYSDYMIFGTLDEEARKQGGINLTEGCWPNSSNEIVVEESIRTKLRLNVGVGEELKLVIEEFDGSKNEYNYLIVGICNNFSELQGGTDNTTEPKYRLPNIIVSDECFMGEPALHHAYISFDSEIALQKFLTDLDVTAQSVFINNKHTDSNSQIKALFTILFFSFLLMGFFAIYANIAINKNRRVKNIYRLKLINVSNWQIKKHFWLEITVYYLISMPLGMLGGTLLSYFIVNNVFNRYITYLQSYTSWYMIILEIIITYLLLVGTQFDSLNKYLNVLPNEIFKKQEIKLHRIKNSKIKSPLLKWGINSFYRNSEIYFKVIIALALLIATIISGSFISKAAVSTLEKKIVSDYTVTEYDGSNFTLLDIPTNFGYGISSEDFSYIKNCVDIDSCYGIKNLPFKIVGENELISEENDLRKRYSDYSVIEDYNRDLLEYGYSLNESLYSIKLLGIDEDLCELLTPYVTEGSIKNIKENSIIIVKPQGKNGYRVGEKIVLSQSFFSSSNEKPDRYDYECFVTAIVEIPENDTKLQKMLVKEETNFIVLSDFLDKLPCDINYNSIYINLDKTSEYENVEKILYGINNIYPNSKIVSLREQVEEQRLSVLSIEITFFTLVLLLILYSVVVYIIVIYNIISERYKLWGTLRCFGTSLMDIMKYQVTELFIIVIISWLIGFVISNIVILATSVNIQWVELYPISAIVSALVFALILCVIISFFIFSKIFRKQIIELLNDSPSSKLI